MSERPIHVQVAEALGFTNIHCDDGPRHSVCASNGWAKPPDQPGISSIPLPNYDLDWWTAGPLIERYSIKLELWAAGSWAASTGAFLIKYGAVGPTPLLAICHLIVLLGKAGVLKDAA